MTLPNAKHAVIDEHKLREYLLSKSHLVGRFKAEFLARLGFTADAPNESRLALRHLEVTAPSRLADATAFGHKYVTRGTLGGPNHRSAPVTIVWIVLHDEERPRLVTVYPGSR